MATRKRPQTAKEEIAEAQRRAKSARTPIAKVVTKQVLDATKRAHSGQGAREAAAQVRRGTQPRTGGTTKAAPRTKAQRTGRT